MAKEFKKRAVGPNRTRTPKTWTAEQVADILKQARSQASDTTIARALDVDVETFRTEWRARTMVARSQGKLEVLQSQFEKARGGDTVSMIWWGKQHLDQTDRKDIDVSGTVSVPALPKTVEEADAQIEAMQKHKASLQSLVLDVRSIEGEFSDGGDGP